MYHSQKKASFVVGGKETDYPEGIFKGIDKAVQQCALGEKVRFTMSAADTGCGNTEYQGRLAVVPPDCQLVIEVTVLAVTRGGTVHNRKQPVDKSGLITKLLYGCCRSY